MAVSKIWQRYFWGKRGRHRDLDTMDGAHGIYFIGCGSEIVYVGQSITNIAKRSIESLAKCYHQVDDVTLPWSIGLAAVEADKDLNELESTSIKKYAPIFNNSIPSKLKSDGEEPEITRIFRVFADQDKNCSAFDPDCMELQAIAAKANPSPPWEKGHKRRQ